MTEKEEEIKKQIESIENAMLNTVVKIRSTELYVKSLTRLFESLREDIRLNRNIIGNAKNDMGRYDKAKKKLIKSWKKSGGLIVTDRPLPSPPEK